MKWLGEAVKNLPSDLKNFSMHLSSNKLGNNP